MPAQYKNIDDYIQTFPPEIQKILQKIRQTIRDAAPEASELISYQMPAFRLNGIVVYFAAHKNHIGFYPTSAGIEAFKRELASYKSSRGAVQFPLDKPVPFDLIRRIVSFRVKENLSKSAARQAQS